MSELRVSRIDRINSLQVPWKYLSKGSPFCSPEWMGAWADTFGSSGTPYVLAVFDKDEVVAIAPFHLHRSLTGARQLDFLGTGKVCSEYLRLLVAPNHLESATEAISKWMMEAAFGSHGEENRWQRLELDSVQADDAATSLLCNKLSSMGAEWIVGESASCWRIDLTASKDQWLANLNKSIRRKLRQLETQAIHCGRAVYIIATTQQERLETFGHLVSLHTARRHQLNEAGCFDCHVFQSFLNQLVSCPNADDLVRVSKLELDGNVVAAGICLESNDGIFVYQAGISLPAESSKDIAASNPGWLLNLCHIEYAWQRKLSFIDYLRGDEKYKSNLGAVPRPQKRFIVVPPIASAQIRQKIWTLAQAAKDIGREVKHILPQF